MAPLHQAWQHPDHPVSPPPAQMTQAQVHLLAQAQQLQQQQQAAAASQQSLTAGVQTPVATLVKTVSAPSALGTSAASVTIPVSAVTMAGVNINVSLPQVGETVGALCPISALLLLSLQLLVCCERKSRFLFNTMWFMARFLQESIMIDHHNRHRE